MILKAFQRSIGGRKCERQVYCFCTYQAGNNVGGYALTFAMPIGFSKVINLNQTEHKDRGLVGPSFCLAYWFDNLQLERRPII